MAVGRTVAQLAASVVEHADVVKAIGVTPEQGAAGEAGMAWQHWRWAVNDAQLLLDTVKSGLT